MPNNVGPTPSSTTLSLSDVKLGREAVEGERVHSMLPLPKSDKAAMCVSPLKICVAAPTNALGPPDYACLQTRQANPNQSCTMHDALPDTEKDEYDSSGILRGRENTLPSGRNPRLKHVR